MHLSLFFLLKLPAGNIHVQEVPDTIRDFNFHFKTLSSQLSSIKKCNEVSSCIVRSECTKTYFMEITIGSSSLTFRFEHGKQINQFQRSFFINTYFLLVRAILPPHKFHSFFWVLQAGQLIHFSELSKVSVVHSSKRVSHIHSKPCLFN